MISIIINIIAIIWGISSFTQKNRRYLSIVISYFILTNGFGIIGVISGGVYPIKNIDFFILYMIALFLASINNKEINIKNDKYAKLLYFFFIFHLGIFFMTIALDLETFKFAIQDSRSLFIYLIYFPLKRINNNQIIKAFKIIFVVELLLGINYLLQFVGIFILNDYDETRLDGGMTRYTNVAPWFLFYLILFILTKQKIRYKNYILLFLGLMLILPMSRMRIILFSIIILYYYFFIKKDYKSIIKILACFFIIGLMFSNFLLARVVSNKENNVSMIDDIKYALEGGYKDFDSESSGTLGFRLAMLFERVKFMNDNPQYALFGVGFKHEESPNCYKNFYFHIGTMSKSLPHLKEEIHSVDINWVRILMQMGYIGVVVYIIFMCSITKLLYNNKDDLICCTGFLYILIFTLGSITEAVWTENHLFKLLVSLLMVYNFNLNNNKYKML